MKDKATQMISAMTMDASPNKNLGSFIMYVHSGKRGFHREPTRRDHVMYPTAAKLKAD